MGERTAEDPLVLWKSLQHSRSILSDMCSKKALALLSEWLKLLWGCILTLSPSVAALPCTTQDLKCPMTKLARFLSAGKSTRTENDALTVSPKVVVSEYGPWTTDCHFTFGFWTRAAVRKVLSASFGPEASRPSRDNQFYIVLSFSSAEVICNGYLPFIIIFNRQRGPTTLFEHTQEMLYL